LFLCEKLVAAAGSLSQDQLHQPLGTGQGTVWRSLVHMYAAEYVWLETLLGDLEALCPGDAPAPRPSSPIPNPSSPITASTPQRSTQVARVP
ncbi:MAG: DinB family protein, partial [Pirellulales bacterium]